MLTQEDAQILHEEVKALIQLYLFKDISLLN